MSEVKYLDYGLFIRHRKRHNAGHLNLGRVWQ